MQGFNQGSQPRCHNAFYKAANVIYHPCLVALWTDVRNIFKMFSKAILLSFICFYLAFHSETLKQKEKKGWD